MANKNDKKKAFLKASVEMLEQAKDAVREKYSNYEGTEETMDNIVELIDTGKEINMAYARNAGYTEDDLKNAEYTKVNGLEVEKYRKHLEKRGMTDEQMREKAYGNIESTTAVASSSTKEKLKNKISHAFARKKDVKIVEEEGITEISPLHRTVVGKGFVKETFIKSEDENTVIKEPIKEFEEPESSEYPKDTERMVKQNSNVQQVDGFVVKTTGKSDRYTFDYSTIPDYVQYDIIPLPSKGECYPSKTSRIPVRYITAADENLIASPNLYANGQLIDALLKRCILDKSFDVDAMCSGDRDAVVLWLRATSYGPEYPMTALNRATNKVYNTKVNLNEFKYIESKLKGDENGWFTYNSDNGNVIKFKYLSKKEIDEVFNDTIGKYVVNTKVKLVRTISDAERYIRSIESESGEHDEVLGEAVAYIKEWVGTTEVDNGEEIYSNAVTENMIKYTMEVNGNSDRDYIRNFVENMRAMEAKAYRDFVAENRPGVDLSVSIPIPESDGGGSFDTFLGIGDTIFINVERD